MGAEHLWPASMHPSRSCRSPYNGCQLVAAHEGVQAPMNDSAAFVGQHASWSTALELSLADKLFERSRARDYGIVLDEFIAILDEIRDRYLPAATGPAEIAAFFSGLRVEELALARGCAGGSEKAWECFLGRYRQKLYAAAQAIAQDAATGRELADTLCSELYGTRTDAAGRRVSKLASYAARGSLDGWLRTILAQEYVNRYRSNKRLVSLEEKEESGRQFVATEQAAQPPPDPRLEQAADEALRALPEDDRLILAAYYLDGRTLAEIGRMLGVHESTVSRRLDAATTATRKRIVKQLRAKGMSAREAEESLQADVRDLKIDVQIGLVQEKSG